MQVLIVDDDIATVDVIQKSIDWEKLGIAGTFTAKNISLKGSGNKNCQGNFCFLPVMKVLTMQRMQLSIRLLNIC